MAQYLSPGVYVEEVPSAIKPIAGVGTSTAGVIGLVADDVEMPDNPGPAPFEVADAGVPELVTNWQEFQNKFGKGVQPGNKMLANAVYGFFNNGGTRCYVARVTDLNVTGEPPVDQVKDALEKFEAFDEIALVAVPMASDLGAGDNNPTRRNAIREMALEHCEKMQDRFAILDGEESVSGNMTPENIYTGKNSNYGAVYFPWIDVSGSGDFVPPCGHIAGLYARVDGERGVHKAPANVTISGARALKHRLSKAHQDGLNPAGINVIRQFNGTITVWGARTIGGDANNEFKYINVRRLFNFLRESIDEGTRWVVFEPNDTGLWQKIRRNVSAFLVNVWRDGALFGDTPEQAFYVKCDAETNPPAVRELGQVVTEIGVAVVKPAEFVIFRVSQWTGGAA